MRRVEAIHPIEPPDVCSWLRTHCNLTTLIECAFDGVNSETVPLADKQKTILLAVIKVQRIVVDKSAAVLKLDGSGLS